MFKNFSVRYEISVHPMLYILEYTRFIGRKLDHTGLHDYYKKKKKEKRKLIEYFISLKNSTKTDTKICVRNYDRISNNTIKVDFLVIGGM